MNDTDKLIEELKDAALAALNKEGDYLGWLQHVVAKANIYLTDVCFTGNKAPNMAPYKGHCNCCRKVRFLFTELELFDSSRGLNFSVQVHRPDLCKKCFRLLLAAYFDGKKTYEQVRAEVRKSPVTTERKAKPTWKLV